MKYEKLLYIISKGENSKIDFKLKLSLDLDSEKKEFSKDICAIANSRSGKGYLIYGIDDKTHKFIGINKSDFSEEKIQQIISSRIYPPPQISLDFVEDSNITIGVITIFNSHQKPHQIKETGAFYIRRGSVTDVMSREEIASILQEHGSLCYETIPIHNSTIDDLNKDKLLEYLKQYHIYDNPESYILKELGITSYSKESSSYVPTCGAIILFGNNPEKFLPHNIIKISLLNNNKETIICTGNIISLLDSTSKIIEKNLPPNIPIDLINDLIGNAVIHRDYFDITKCIEITIYDTSIEITNPGYVLDNISPNSKYTRRNLWLYLKLLSIDSKKTYFNKPKYSTKNITINQENIPDLNIFKINISSNK